MQHRIHERHVDGQIQRHNIVRERDPRRATAVRDCCCHGNIGIARNILDDCPICAKTKRICSVWCDLQIIHKIKPGVLDFETDKATCVEIAGR